MNNRPAGRPDPGKKRTNPSADKRINRPASAPAVRHHTDKNTSKSVTNGDVRHNRTHTVSDTSRRIPSSKPVHGTKPSKPVSKKASKPALTPREKAILAEQKRLEEIRKRKAFKAFREKFRAVMVFALIGAVLALGAVFAYVYFNFNSKDKVPEHKVRVTLSDQSLNVLEEDESFYRNGQHYVSLSKICELSSLTLHGDTKSMTVSFTDSLYVTFKTGTNIAEVSGMNCVMTGKSYFEYGQMFIPCSFFTEYCYGINVVHQESGKNKGCNITFDKQFGLLAKSFEESYPNAVAKQASDEKDNSNADDMIPVFKSNLLAYETYMNPGETDEFLTLINEAHPLAENYSPDDLTEIRYTRNDGRDTQKLRLYAAKALEAMLIEMRSHGYSDVTVTRGYSLSDGSTPNSSAEHRSGLAVDLHNVYTESEAFAQTDAYKWLFRNCADFGFILRYPKDKTQITGVSFEPWHYRYVGRYHARRIMESGMCLEEYLA
ncbi:MAG: D-alanyl-D-alanine carboxypeptidase family protein [Ruminococcaceae bacterium]|nr:D-alanyl-D-alanine carboxypeptidase family protein [Oscillospiraceae bacterium]